MPVEPSSAPFQVELELAGWRLFWAHLSVTPETPTAELSLLRDRVATETAARFELETIAADPTVAALRVLFKQAGTSPSRYRPSSEALIRRLVKGEPIPEIHPLVDLNNCLSARLAVPCCVMDERRLAPPFTFRAGRAGEAYESLRGPFKLEGRPLLLDAEGPCDAPITGGVRVKVDASSTTVWLVAYMPEGPTTSERAAGELEALLAAAPVATLCSWFTTP